MTSGSKLVLPMVVLNMGGEMVNILHQRLNAQKVEADKRSTVLRDVISIMYAPKVPPRHAPDTKILLNSEHSFVDFVSPL